MNDMTSATTPFKPPAPEDADDFYARLPVLESLEAAFSPSQGVPVPDSWFIVLTDVRGSTHAISQGRYREVNLLGAATITASLNALNGKDVPFAFGGDGAVICVPPSAYDAVRRAVGTLRTLAQRELGLELRAGIVPVSAVNAAGGSLVVSRYLRSRSSIQAVFAGGGTQLAERFIKDPGRAKEFEIPACDDKADLTGLECRWADVPSAHGETISLIIDTLSEDPREVERVYGEVAIEIDRIYGGDANSHPIMLEHLSLTFDSAKLRGEVSLRSPKNGFSRFLYRGKLYALVALGRLLLARGIRVSGVDWGSYREELTRNTDHRRFVDGFRFVLSGTTDQRLALEALLEDRFQAGELVFGLHASDRAIVTCMVFDYCERHMHFVDAADGGFALAAKDLKHRKKIKVEDTGFFQTPGALVDPNAPRILPRV